MKRQSVTVNVTLKEVATILCSHTLACKSSQRQRMRPPLQNFKGTRQTDGARSSLHSSDDVRHLHVIIVCITARDREARPRLRVEQLRLGNLHNNTTTAASELQTRTSSNREMEGKKQVEAKRAVQVPHSSAFYFITPLGDRLLP